MPNMRIRLGCSDAQSGNAVTDSITSSYDSAFRQDPTLRMMLITSGDSPGVTSKGARLNHAGHVTPDQPQCLAVNRHASSSHMATLQNEVAM
jgi:hypothetical protein